MQDEFLLQISGATLSPLSPLTIPHCTPQNGEESSHHNAGKWTTGGMPRPVHVAVRVTNAAAGSAAGGIGCACPWRCICLALPAAACLPRVSWVTLSFTRIKARTLSQARSQGRGPATQFPFWAGSSLPCTLRAWEPGEGSACRNWGLCSCL